MYLISKGTKKYLFILFLILLILIIIFLAYRLYQIVKGDVKGIQYTTRIDKNTIQFDSGKGELKYFFEPASNKNLKYHTDWLKYDYVNTINSDSLNDRYDYNIKKDNTIYRIITLGDSFTYGAYVNTPENYSEVLEDLLNTRLKCNRINKFEVINLGVGAYDIRYEVERFKKRGIKYTPDLVVWLLHGWNFQIVNEYYMPLVEQLDASFKRENKNRFDQGTGQDKVGIEAYHKFKERYNEEEILEYQKKQSCL